jgi:hypothetical protein
VTYVTGAAIPEILGGAFRHISCLTGGFPRRCAHWLGMTENLADNNLYMERSVLIEEKTE